MLRELKIQTQSGGWSLSISGREGCSTTAGAGGIGVAKFETAAIKPGGKVDDRAGEIGSASAIDINFHPIQIQNQVLWLLLLVEIQLVRITRASAIGHCNAQSVPFAPVASQELSDLFGGTFG